MNRVELMNHDKYDNRNMGTFTDWVIDNYSVLRENIGTRWAEISSNELFHEFFHAYHEEYFRVRTPVALMELQAERDKYNDTYWKYQDETDRARVERNESRYNLAIDRDSGIRTQGEL